MNTEKVIYELNVIRNAYKLLTTSQRSDIGYIQTLVDRYSLASAKLDATLNDLYFLRYIKGWTYYAIASYMHFDKRTVIRMNDKLISTLSEAMP